MGDEPEVRKGTRQPSGRITTDFHLNDAFVDAVGETTAARFLDLLHGVSRSHGGQPIVEIEKELRRRVTELGITVTDVELDSFADQIRRSEGTVEHIGPDEAAPRS
ncbi:hypothetical protein SAMN05421595_0418 [Austwickia chelonae]|uniref:Uncharacterized protein n=1 Tax=Austwickia chelonae NBRC 105200 TaxID=1184607 RepID=K6W7U4_9MICO|nr:hypothetical protein [Austwickia chelonae]GAB77907.1 hypothetical protein AUCHE_08_01500 [Austwickia chelonae NBRC 105200]SEV91981.1 hypothetical protein SAMN05421595_0418 [Austwickia chelonae]